MFDRRESPSNGYRAVHVVVRHLDLPIEIQVRTALQHVWAELSEKLSDVVDPAVKYGGGPPRLIEFLQAASKSGALLESFGVRFAQPKDGRQRELFVAMAKDVERARRQFAESLQKLIGQAHKWKDV